jgi:hypothetical protein
VRWLLLSNRGSTRAEELETTAHLRLRQRPRLGASQRCMSQQALARGWRCCSPLADVRVPDHLQTHRLGLGRCCYRVKGAATAVAVETAGLPRGCRTNQHHPRLLVRLPQGHDFGESHFGRGEPRPAGWVALTRSAEMAVVKFVQGVWFVRQPRRKATTCGPTDDRPQKSPQACFPSPTSTSPPTTRALQSPDRESASQMPIHNRTGRQPGVRTPILSAARSPASR